MRPLTFQLTHFLQQSSNTSATSNTQATNKNSEHFYFLNFMTAGQHALAFLWPPCIADADIIFLPGGFFLLLSSFFIPRLISAVADWISTKTTHIHRHLFLATNKSFLCFVKSMNYPWLLSNQILWNTTKSSSCTHAHAHTHSGRQTNTQLTQL